MRRRDFIALIGGAVAGRSIAARAQQEAGHSVHLGFLGAATATGYAAEVEALRAGLRDLGYAEGKDLVIDFRWAKGKYDQLPELARELVGLNVDVLVTHGTPGALAAEKATSTIPIVMAIIGDPIATGIVSSIRRPDRNITGSSFFSPELAAKRIELIKQGIPHLARVGMLVNPDNRSMDTVFDAASRTAGALGLALQQFRVQRPSDFDDAIKAVRASHADALLIPEDGMLIANVAPIVRLATDARIPTIGFQQVATSGGFMAYGVNIPQTFRYAAVFIDKIIKGARPEDLPIERATKFEMTINLKTARALGIDVPPQLLALADQVIE